MDNLVGLFFHSYTIVDKKPVIRWQGQVLKQIAADKYLVQLYDFVCGAPSDQKIIHARDMDNWSYYPDITTMNESYYRKSGIPSEWASRVQGLVDKVTK